MNSEKQTFRWGHTLIERCRASLRYDDSVISELGQQVVGRSSLIHENPLG